MLKKLQNLLFEDDEDDYLDDEEPEEVEQPAAVRPARTAAEQVRPVEQPQPQQEEPVQTKEQPHMNRIDVTGFVPVQEARPEQPPVQQPVKEEKKTLGITADGYKASEKTKSVRTVKPARAKTQKPAKKTSQKTVYEFQPVISPIFGVDEKDLTALKTTTKKVAQISAQAEDDGNITPVISPIYGSTQKNTAAEEPEEESRTSVSEASAKQPVSSPAEDEIPEFSLDDILKVRDEEYDNAADTDLGNTAPLFPDLDLQFPDDPVEDQPAEEPDQTQVIRKPSRKK